MGCCYNIKIKYLNKKLKLIKTNLIGEPTILVDP
jgi:hypothetical protein